MSSETDQLGFDALLADAESENRIRAFDRETAHLPGTINAAIPFYRQQIDAHHAAMLICDFDAAMAIREEAHLLARKLNGGKPGILAHDDARAKCLRVRPPQHRAPSRSGGRTATSRQTPPECACASRCTASSVLAQPRCPISASSCGRWKGTSLSSARPAIAAFSAPHLSRAPAGQRQISCAAWSSFTSPANSRDGWWKSRHAGAGLTLGDIFW